jgi:NAD+ synthase
MMALVPRFDPELVEVAVRFIRHRVMLARARGAVVGISGGIDSAVVAALCVRALGKERVLGLMMPEEKPEKEAPLCIKWLGIRGRLLPIKKQVEAVVATLRPRPAKDVLGNIKARLRMLNLYTEANGSHLLVVGTGNKSELLTGYFTKYGDGGVDLLPIGDLYKTQVREMAEALGVPEVIRKLVPTAGLYPGQTDEGELGISYPELDRVLMGLELRLDHAKVAKQAGVPLSEVVRIARRVEASIHKRATPPIPKMGIRTIGVDWREESPHPDEEE